ncbi:MAG: primosomal protein N', partial [Alphaproteobacteria bacterium]
MADLLGEDFETATSAAHARTTVPVLLPLAIDTTYDYLPPADAPDLAPGDFVLAPIGPRKEIGVVWERSAGAKSVDPRKLKTIVERFDLPPLPDVSRRFAEWVARYTLSPRGMVLKMMMSAGDVFSPDAPRWGYRLAGPPPARLTPGRKRVLEVASEVGAAGVIWQKSDLANRAGVSYGVIDGLAVAGTFQRVELPRTTPPQPAPDHAPPTLSEGQSYAAHSLCETLRQFLSRFERRFGCRPTEWHSSISPGERARSWRAVAEGEARVVAGARSALFLPYRDLGLIVVDEEHDSAFKQEDNVRYHARDMAVVRGSLGKNAVMLASATPSLESVVNAQNGRYRQIVLPQRYSGAQMPELTAIDLRATPPERGRWIAPPLVEAINETLERGQQSLLFLNRRGYAPLTICRKCGHRIECPQCSVTLVEHRHRAEITCHHCGFTLPSPKLCPKCENEGTLVPCGPGVERVAEEVAERWPGVETAIWSSDLVPTLKALREVI